MSFDENTYLKTIIRLQNDKTYLSNEVFQWHSSKRLSYYLIYFYLWRSYYLLKDLYTL